MDFWLAGLKTLGFKQFLWRLLVSCWQHECHFDSGLFKCGTSSPSLSLPVSLSPLLPPCLPHFLLTSLNLFCPHSQMMTLFHISLRDGRNGKRMYSLSLTLNKFFASVPFFLLLLVFPLCLCYTFCNYPTVLLPFSFFFFPLCFKFESFY